MQILIDSSAVTLGLSVINATSLIVMAIWLFKQNYTIVDLSTWNTIVKKYNEVQEAENDNCGGGVGFQVYSNEEEEDE